MTQPGGLYSGENHYRGVARIFHRKGGGGRGRGRVTLCHTQSTYQIGKSTSTPCVTKSDFSFRMSSERGEGTSLQHNCKDELSSPHEKLLSFNVLNDFSHSAKVTCNVRRIDKGGGGGGFTGKPGSPPPSYAPALKGHSPFSLLGFSLVRYSVIDSMQINSVSRARLTTSWDICK